ncbi:hypothetical protein MKW94_028714 [Papaver nudicaule]|uniref:F-box/LRR-repeat protein 15-like leucin rich repeat domain-containing protein n=1 Tax=Papaver nudicaule TaxID=74823 RepID=A0AA41SA52_PAPNU|nr:hypothetical protein [Papaver nudicaule]
MSLLSGKYNQGSGKIFSSKEVQQEGNNVGDDDRPPKNHRTSSVTRNLPGDCLNLIYKRLETAEDRNSFGLTCHQWLDIQSNNYKSLWYRHGYGSSKFPIISHEILPMVLCKLLTRFQHLKKLSLRGHPKITDFVASKPPSYESKVQHLRLDHCFTYSDAELSLMISWFPCLTKINLGCTRITDEGLWVLAECCSSLKKVDLSSCQSFTDSGISFLLRKCRALGSLDITYCRDITGIGFLGCPMSLTKVKAARCKLTPEGLKAIVSGGGLQCLHLALPYGSINNAGERCIINTEAIVTISKGCPLMHTLILPKCDEVDLQGWEAIGENCKNLKNILLRGCRKLCDLGLQALSTGCNKLSNLTLDKEYSCSRSALEIFKHEKPDVLVLRKNY